MVSDSAGSNAQCVIISFDLSSCRSDPRQQVAAKQWRFVAAGMQAAGSRAKHVIFNAQGQVLGKMGNCLNSCAVRANDTYQEIVAPGCSHPSCISGGFSTCEFGSLLHHAIRFDACTCKSFI